MYSLEDYVQFGHWLVVAANGDATVNTFAQRFDLSTVGGTTPTNPGSWAGPAPDSTNAGMRESSAVYSGMAAGRSVHKTLDGDGDITNIQSGRFTATVTLTAVFAGDSSTLGGEVTGFMSPDNPGAVDEDWSVTLNSKAISSSAPSFTDGVTEATGQNGVWSATSYGASLFGDAGPTTAAPTNAGRRPAGIFGGFTAHFTDGHAPGRTRPGKSKGRRS
jgi:hypothetical protein